MRTTFIGLDFSGARDAGRHAWISQGRASHSRLEVWDCRPAAELPGSGTAREVCLPALARWISELGDCLIGCDFPFSLPLEVMGLEGWETFVSRFARRFPTPEALRTACQSQEGHERRRQTDRETRAPFGPGNLRLYRQTYYGIRGVLSPLVRAGAACVLPFQHPIPGRPWLIEVCPAVTLRWLDLYGRSYKGPGERQRLERWRLLDRLVERGMQLPARVRQRALDDDGGDALDSLVALLTAWSVRDALVVEAPLASEGYIYVPKPTGGTSKVHIVRDERPAHAGCTGADQALHSA
ncbi:hypothetical protein HRbin26_02349 [bacterium HR26]|nr:hypothetical protein HRbin26_02349 [bacterium HR26]